MVQIYCEDVANKIASLQPNRRMPFLCSANRTFGWRILSENYEKHVKGVRSEVHDITIDHNTYQNYLTSMALSDNGTAAIGSGNKDGPLYFVQDLSARRDVEQGSRFKTLTRKDLGAPIHSLDWAGDLILVGLTKGATKLFRCDLDHCQGRIKELSSVGQYKTAVDEIPITSSSFVPNTHVKTVEFSPNHGTSTTCSFLTTTMNQLQTWDVRHQNEPLTRNNISEGQLNSASWSPTHPESLVVCGGQDKSLKIIDVRVPPTGPEGQQQHVVWSTVNAHDRAIRDVKFNPFIPYWLASAGEDAVVNIWDIRASYHMPVAKIDGHNGIVTSVTWSNIRPENLCTSSSDGTMRCFTLSPEQFPTIDTYHRLSNYNYQDTLPIVRENDEVDTMWSFNKYHNRVESSLSSSNQWMSQLWSDIDNQDELGKSKRSTMLLVGALGLGEWGIHEPGTIYKGENTSNARGSVMQVKASKCRPCTYYSITDGGQFASHTVRFDVSSHLRSRHRFDAEDKTDLSAKIEDDIYCRRISEAQRKLVILKNAPVRDEQEADQRREEVEFLEDCLKLREPISQWAPDSLPDKSSKRISRRLWSENDLWELSINTFKSDLRYWSYRIPPGYNAAFNFPLDFNEPIIAAHLVEEEKVLKELPPLILRHDSVDSFFAYDDGSLTSNYSCDQTEDMPIEKLYDNTIKTDASDKDTSEEVTGSDIAVTKDSNEQVPIKDRRKMSHISPIHTASTGADRPSRQSESTNPFTPPQSANILEVANTLSTTSIIPAAPSTVTENNPFITVTDQQSPALTPRSTNPFEMTEQANSSNAPPKSTNPFEEQPVNNATDRLSAVPTKGIDSASELSSASPRQSTSSSRYSLDSSLNEGQRQQLKAQKGKQHHLMHNPFKKLRSRQEASNSNQTDTDKQAAQHLQRPTSTDSNGNFINRVSAELMRKSSSRRNALHGPF